MQFHEVANVFPPMSEREFVALKEDIAEHGLKQPIVVHDGKIVDGRHRYRACVELGTEPSLTEWSDEGSLVAFAVSMNLRRRHLSTSQRALLAAELKPLFEQEARARQGTRTDLGANLREGDRGKASVQAAEIVGVSARSVETARRVRQRAVPELMEAVRRGDVAVSMAAAIADLAPDDQKKIASIKDKRSVRKAVQEMRQATQSPDPSVLSPAAKGLVEPVLRLLEGTASLLGDRDPAQVAGEFFEQFPFNQPGMVKRLSESVAGATLMCEVYRIWESTRAKAV